MESRDNTDKSESGEGISDSKSKESSSSNGRVSSISHTVSYIYEDSKSVHELTGKKKRPTHKEEAKWFVEGREEFKFPDLSEVDIPDTISDPGGRSNPENYGFYADHTPSDMVKLSDKDSKPATDELPKTEKLSVVKSAQPNSHELNLQKLSDYIEKNNRIEEIKENQNNEEKKFDENNERLKNQNDKEIIDDVENNGLDEEEKIPNEHANKRNDIGNRLILRRAMVNNYSDINIFISMNDFSDHGSREVTGYYGQNNYIIPSNFASMVSSELNNKEDLNLDVSHQLPLPNTKVVKSIPYSSKPAKAIKAVNVIKSTRDIDPILFYTQVTERTGGWEVDGKEYELKDFTFYLNLSDESSREVILNSRRLNRIPNIRIL